jgi:hypothetical protein
MRLAFVFVFGLSLCAACTSKEGSTDTPNTEPTATDSLSLPEDFLVFYKQFHKDSAYQMDHILFPLAGLPTDADTLSKPQHYRHKREDWILHKPFNDPFGDYVREYATPSEDVVIERFVLPTVGYYIERRFAKMDDEEWYLIYYSNVNRLPSQ